MTFDPDPAFDAAFDQLAKESGMKTEMHLQAEERARATQVGGDHYRRLDVQPWDAMEAWLTPEQFIGYLRGNAIKYLSRAGSKGDAGEDYRKAQHYLAKLIETGRG